MNIIHTVASIAKKDGGPSRTVTSLCDMLGRRCDATVSLLTQQYANEPLVELPPDSPVRFKKVTSGSSFMIKSGLAIKYFLQKQIDENRPEIVNDHGVWLPSNHFVSSLCKRNSIPRVVHPRGMLEPWAMTFKKTKKTIAYWLYQHKDLSLVSLFIATSETEAVNLRQLGFKQPIAIIPNGVDLTNNYCNDHTHEKLDGRIRTVLFLSRIHPIKGILNLLDAWVELKPQGWKLVVAGPDEGGYINKVHGRIKELNLTSIVEYVGEVEGKQKSDLFSSADIFILPSFSENFGVVVAEALAHGTPVITTTGTPWSELPLRGCGWCIEPNVESISSSLQEAMRMPKELLRAMGMRGIDYAMEFNWPAIAEKTCTTYRWLLGQASRPDYVYVD